MKTFDVFHRSVLFCISVNLSIMYFIIFPAIQLLSIKNHANFFFSTGASSLPELSEWLRISQRRSTLV